jgi:hypothetical protein
VTFAMQQLRLAAWAAICVLAAALAMHQCEPAPAYAQAADASLLLAKVCVNEAGFDGIADCDAIAAISIRQARLRGMPLGAYLQARFRRALAPVDARRNRPWIAGLQRNHRAPAHWPHQSQPWSARSASWRALLARTDDVVAGRVTVECNAQTWGSPVYDAKNIARILANGGRVVPCGRTRNQFLRFQ